MLDSRSYMRGSQSGLRLPATVILMIVIGAAFLLQQINYVYFRSPLEQYLGLSVAGIKRGYLWQFLTFQFLHAGGFHLLGNMIGLWFFGRYLEERLGPKRMLTLYFASGVIGGLLQVALMFAFPAHFGTLLFGASAGVCGLLAAFCLLEPEGQILLFFVLPVRARYLLIFFVGIALFFTLVPSGNVAHAAHLGGLLSGIAYIRWELYNWDPSFRFRLPRLSRRAVPGKVLKVRFPKGADGGSASNQRRADTSEEFISREVDPILEKISAQGIQSLTAREREILQAARSRMSKR
jgi:membrane associated rhomboid family serine protease